MLLHDGIQKCMNSPLDSCNNAAQRRSFFTVILHQSYLWTPVQNTLLAVWSEHRMWHWVTWYHCYFTWIFWHCVFMKRWKWWSIRLWYVKILELCVCGVYMYTSGPKYFSVNADSANCIVVFILSTDVLTVTFMKCETVCIKIMFVWCVLLYSFEPSTNIFICKTVCLVNCCTRYIQNIDTNLVRLTEIVNRIYPPKTA